MDPPALCGSLFMLSVRTCSSDVVSGAARARDAYFLLITLFGAIKVSIVDFNGLELHGITVTPIDRQFLQDTCTFTVPNRRYTLLLSRSCHGLHFLNSRCETLRNRSGGHLTSWWSHLIRSDWKALFRLFHRTTR